MTSDMHKAPSVARKALNSPGSATPVARYDLSTSEGGRRYIAELFATELRRHDFTDYISTRLAADFACALAQHLAATGKQQVGEVQGDAAPSPGAITGSLRAMVRNYSEGHRWDHLDARMCRAAADRIESLEEALAARQPGAQVPVAVEAVATIKRDGDGELYVDRLTEGGIHDLPVGDVLLAANSAITNDEGYGEVYAAPPAQGIDLHRLVPPEWLSEQLGGPFDDLTPGQAWRQGFNQCRARALLLVEQAMGFPAEQQCDAVPRVDRA